MFEALGKFFRALGYLVTLQFNKFTNEFSNRPGVVGLRYDEVIRDKKRRIDEYINAVTQIEVLREKNVQTLKKLSGEIHEAREELAAIVEEAKSAEPESEEYLTLMQDYNDIKSTLEEKERRVADLESAIESYRQSLQDHKLNLQQLIREVDEVKKEKADAVAEMISAKEEEKMARVIAGISNDSTSKELEELRQARAEQKGRATISKEISGMDPGLKRQKRLSKIRGKKFSDEFSNLVQAGVKTDKAEGAGDEKTRTPVAEQ
ncbi:MAG: hypothetical protein PHQ23_12795 [Candidatus Wallbacteria bacterium]|nr:hypothetical protein [Candidatus Wallbacteria bacterium]